MRKKAFVTIAFGAAICSAVATGMPGGSASAAASAGAAAASARAGARRAAPPIYLDPRYLPAERAADLVARLTLAEKAQQMDSSPAPAIPRLGVAAWGWWNEANHGVRPSADEHRCQRRPC